MATFCLLGLVGGSYAAPITTTVTTVLLTRGLGIALCANATASERSQELLESGLARAKRGDLSGALEFFWGSLGVELRTAHPADRVSWGLHDTKGKCAPEELTALPIAGSPSAAAAAGALHSIGNFHILQAQFEAAVDCHALAKSVDPTSTPPLARLCPPGLHNPCGAALADLFFSSSVVKQVLWQRQQDPEPQQESLNGTPMAQVHTDLATQLDASGLTAEAERHRLRAHDAQIATSGQAHVGLAVHGALAVPLLYDSTEHVARERQRLLQRIAQLHTRVKTDGLVLADGELNSFSMPGTFKIAYQGFNDALLMRDIGQLYRQLHPKLDYTSRYAATPPLKGQRKRIGFLSAHWREHSVCKLLCAVIHGLDRQEFEVVLLSSSRRQDVWTSHALGEVSCPFGHASSQRSAPTAELVNLPNGLLAGTEQIAGLRLDVLVFADIGMETTTYMWAFARMARVQVQFWGHPISAGTGAIDYFVSSQWDWQSDSEHGPPQSHFNEQLVLLEPLSFAFHRPPEPSAGACQAMLSRLSRLSSILAAAQTSPSPWDEVDVLSANVLSATESVEPFVVVVPQAVMKFHPSFDKALYGVLHGFLAANVRILVVIVDHAGTPVNRHQLRLRLTRSLASSDFALAHHVVFLPRLDREQFSALLSAATVALDTFPFGGGVTTLETLALGTPVLTLPSKQNVPQLAAGMLRRMDAAANRTVLVQSLVARDVAHFISLTMRLGTDQEVLSSVRAAIISSRDVLFDSKDSIAAWSRFLARV